MSNYVVYHLHSDLSNGVTNIDSVTKYNQYIDYAKSLGMSAMAFSEHGSVFQWLKKKEAIEKAGMKYIHASEFYVTETLDEKLRDNYHVVLIAKNYDGFLELNRLSSQAFNRSNVKIHDDLERFYYAPRITYQELINTSDNIIITTACLANILNKGNDNLQTKFIQFLTQNKHRCFLEIQHHNVKAQADYNKKLLKISQETNIPLIAGTDTHCLDERHSKGRSILQKSKNIFFADEDGWDLTFKNYDQLCRAYQNQGVLHSNVFLQAIQNTNAMADMIESFELDRSYKYPHLWENPLKLFKEKVREGAIKRGVDKFPNKQEYYKRANYETKAYVHNQAIDFMLLTKDIIDFCNENNIGIGYGRGSVNGSVIAWMLGITEMDSIKHNLNFERFMNVERVSLSDIDTDFPPSDRERVKQYICNKKGLYCSDIVTFNTIALKGAIRDVARAMEIPLKTVDEICKSVDVNEDVARQQYPELFEYVDIVNGTIVSVGSHPCGLITAPHTIDDRLGLFTTTTSNYPISQINMKEVDSLNYVKLDLLALDTIELINETCKLAGIERLTPDNVDITDINVWNSIRDDTTQIFQWEGNMGNDYIKKLLSDENIKKFKAVNENIDRMTLLSIGNSAIRPAGASYRDDLANGVVRKTGSKVIDDFLSNTFGYLVFQCQIIEFLHKYCGFTMGEADVVRRGFAKKTGTEQFIPVIKDGGYLNGNTNHYIKGFIATMQDKYSIPKEKSEKDIVDFIQVINDASDYLFSLNHSQPYSYEGYVSGYLRYYYPVEFLTTALNINQDKQDKTKEITAYAKKVGITIKPAKFRYSSDVYMPDKENKAIYKGVASIKYLNADVAKVLYEMRNDNFNSFIDFLRVNPCNSRQTEILIKLGYFSEFGKSQKLLKVYGIYDKFNGKKQIAKDKIELPEEIVLKYATATSKMYKFADIDGLIQELCDNVEDKNIPTTELLITQSECLGYLDYTNPQAIGYGFVLDINTKYTPKITLYKLDTGEIVTVKVGKKMFTEYPFEKNMILKKIKTEKRNKSHLVDGKWVKDENEYDTWMTSYVVR